MIEAPNRSAARNARPTRRVGGAAAAILLGALALGSLIACADQFRTERPITIGQSDIRRLEIWQAALPRSLREERVRAAADASAGGRTDVAEIAANAARERRQGDARVDAAFIPLLIDTAAGRTFLRAPSDGRALALGAPALSCPAVGLAVRRPDLETAGAAALTDCFDALETAPRIGADADAACGCRLVAVGDTLLAEREAFARARAVSVVAIDPRTRRRAPLTTQITLSDPDLSASAAGDAQRLAAEHAGAGAYTLRSAVGPVAELSIAPDGAARLIRISDDAQFDGLWRAEGLRRGRPAGIAALQSAEGQKMILLFGYEPAEISIRGEELTARAGDLY